MTTQSVQPEPESQENKEDAMVAVFFCHPPTWEHGFTSAGADPQSAGASKHHCESLSHETLEHASAHAW